MDMIAICWKNQLSILDSYSWTHVPNAWGHHILFPSSFPLSLLEHSSSFFFFFAFSMSTVLLQLQHSVPGGLQPIVWLVQYLLFSVCSLFYYHFCTPWCKMSWILIQANIFSPVSIHHSGCSVIRFLANG